MGSCAGTLGEAVSTQVPTLTEDPPVHSWESSFSEHAAGVFAAEEAEPGIKLGVSNGVTFAVAIDADPSISTCRCTSSGVGTRTCTRCRTRSRVNSCTCTCTNARSSTHTCSSPIPPDNI